jgi:hypothetical protein
LAPLTPTDDDATVKAKLEAVATYLDIWLMRRVVNYIRVGYSATNYAMYLLCRDIRQKPLFELKAILKERLINDEVNFDGHEAKNREGINDLRLNQFSRRYIYHILARMTAYVETGAGRPDLFDKYVNREGKNTLDIEHIWADNYELFSELFSSTEEFQRCRNHIAGLLLLPADVNRSYQDKSYAEKSHHYAKQNLLAASLTSQAYEHQPQFTNFILAKRLPFKAYIQFGKDEHLERRELVKTMVNQIWSIDRLS